MTHVNDTSVNDGANTAFGGKKASGIGRFGRGWAVGEFTTHHWVSVQRTPRSFPIWRPLRPPRRGGTTAVG